MIHSSLAAPVREEISISSHHAAILAGMRVVGSSVGLLSYRPIDPVIQVHVQLTRTLYKCNQKRHSSAT